VTCHEQGAVTQVPLIDLQPWYSYVLKTERPEAPEGEASATPLRAGPSYVPEQPVTVSLLMEVGKEIMSLYGKTGATFASALAQLGQSCSWCSRHRVGPTLSRWQPHSLPVGSVLSCSIAHAHGCARDVPAACSLGLQSSAAPCWEGCKSPGRKPCYELLDLISLKRYLRHRLCKAQSCVQACLVSGTAAVRRCPPVQQARPRRRAVHSLPRPICPRWWALMGPSPQRWRSLGPPTLKPLRTRSAPAARHVMWVAVHDIASNLCLLPGEPMRQ
jgi:hypothetical protein